MLAFYLSIIETEKERDSFSAIYDNYLDWMLKVAYHFSGNIHDAEEIVHDVFMNIAEYNISVPTKNEDETKAYLFICIRNKAISVLKQKGRITTVSIDDFFQQCVAHHITCIKKDKTQFRQFPERLQCPVQAGRLIFIEIRLGRIAGDHTA